MPTVKFFTLGCKVNQYDTQSLREQFSLLGFREGSPRTADVCVINTCTVTASSDSQSYALIRKAARDHPESLIVVTGCLAETDARSLRRLKSVGLVVPNRHKDRLVHEVARRLVPGAITHPRRDSPSEGWSGISFFQGRTRAFLKVQDGCDNRCSYCKVPFARGSSRSKPPDAVLREASRLRSNGYKEIVLCGVCLGSYGRDLVPRLSLTDLLARLESLGGPLRVRLSSIEAADVTPSLVGHLSRSAAVCRHLHIPLQSGDDCVLKAMNRKYTRRGYLALVRRIRDEIGDIALTTDVMAGFPGETRAQFMRTVDLIEQVRPLNVHVFPYSERAGTPSSRVPGGSIPAAVINERARILREVARRCTEEYLRSCVGGIEDVLFEERCRGAWVGHSARYIKVTVRSAKDLGNVRAPVQVKAVTAGGVSGVLA